MARAIGLCVVATATLGPSFAGAQTPSSPPPEQAPTPAEPPAPEPGPAPAAVEPPPAIPPAPPAPPEAPVEEEAEVTGIRGRVIDAKTGEPLIEASVRITRGTKKQARTDVEGRFVLRVPPGSYDLRVGYELYKGRRLTGVVVRANEATDVEIALEPDESAVEEVVVEAKADKRTEAGILQSRKKATTTRDAISAEQIARSPDSNASDAVKRLPAATVQDNRYIVIRGLGGRYSLTLLNGVPLPSPDPDVPAAPLDLFPASLLENLTVVKTASPDLPANFAGGVLLVETRSFPSKFTLKLRAGAGGNTATTFEPNYGYAGGDLDSFGYDDGTRALPSTIPRDRLAADASTSQEEANRQGASFKNNWALRRKDAGPNATFGTTVGDTLKLRGQRLGYLANVNFGHSRTRRQSHITRVGEPDGMGGLLPGVLQLDEDRGVEQASMSGLGAVGWEPTPANSVNAVALYAHSGDKTASRTTGTDNSTAVIDRTRLQFVERQMVFGQLVGEHPLLGHRLVLGWQGNVAVVEQDEPDTRDLLRTQVPDGRTIIPRASGSTDRLFSTLQDTTGGGGGDLTVPLRPLKLKAGGSILHTRRTYQTRRFHFDIYGDDAFLPAEEALAPENIGTSVLFSERTLPTDGYEATRTVTAAYAMADIVRLDPLRIVAGARFEQSQLDVEVKSKIDLMAPPMEVSKRTDRDVLPSMALIYAVTTRSNLRGTYARTVARPNFREIAPALYYDYTRRRAIGGNPDLVETRIQNGDLRWETFLAEGEVLAASLFYKRFADPIERTVEDASDGQNVGFSNAESADSYGVELESRLSLRRAARALRAFSVGANLSLIGSRVEIMGVSRSLQGQSPYVVNVDLGYELLTLGTRFDLLYNVFGARIDEVGTGGAGNVYEQPVHRVDFTVGQPLPAGFRFKLAAANLLDERARFTQNGVDILSYPLGVTISGSLEWSAE